MDPRPTPDATPPPADAIQTGYVVDRFGSMRFADVLASLVRGVDLDTIAEAIHEVGLEAVAEQVLRALIDAGALHADVAGATAEEDSILATDPQASPTVHPITVADLADEFTRLDLTNPATSCRQALAFRRAYRARCSRNASSHTSHHALRFTPTPPTATPTP